MSDVLDKWLEHYDPIHRGWTLAGIANGVTLANGFACPRIRGGYNLYRGPNRDEINTICGAADRVSNTIRPWFGRVPGTWYYQCRPIGPGGVEAVVGDSGIVTVRVRSDGVTEGVLPAAPRSLRATATTGGAFLLAWDYVAARGFATVKRFAIYSDNGIGSIDYTTPVALLAARISAGGAGAYAWTSALFPDYATVQFAVRARNAGGEESNMIVVSAVADATGPAAAQVVATTREVDE